MEPRACPLCGGLFIQGGPVAFVGNRAVWGQVPLDSAEPILPYKNQTGVTAGRCPHCEKPLTSEAFRSTCQLIPYNASMLESEVQDVAEGTPLRIPAMSTKMSQDDVTGWIEERNHEAAYRGRK
jgi:hypothetical protein